MTKDAMIRPVVKRKTFSVEKQLDALIKLQESHLREVKVLREKNNFLLQEENALRRHDELRIQLIASKEKSIAISMEIEDLKKLLAIREEELQIIREKEKSVSSQREYEALDGEASVKIQEIFDLKSRLEKQCEEEKHVVSEYEIVKKSEKDQERDLKVLKSKNIERCKELENVVLECFQIRERESKNISVAILKNFNLLVTGKSGVALASVVEGACEGCNMALPNSVLSKVRLKKEIVTCKHCTKILYV